MKKPKPVAAFRLDPRLVEEVRSSGINLAYIIEASLAKVLKFRKCPYCDQKIKGGGAGGS